MHAFMPTGSVSPPLQPLPTTMATYITSATASQGAAILDGQQQQQYEHPLPTPAVAEARPIQPHSSKSTSVSTSTLDEGVLDGFEQIAAKSCLRCRDRKVKCDRLYPNCGRCLSRKEACGYKVGMMMYVSTKPITSNADESCEDKERDSDTDFRSSRPRPIDQDYNHHLRHEVPGASYELAQETLGGPLPQPDASMPSRSIARLPQRPLSNHVIYAVKSNRYYDSAPPQDAPYEDTGFYPPMAAQSTSDDYADAMQTTQTYRERLDLPQDTLLAWHRLIGRDDIGERSVDWQLARPTMATSLQRHLLEASMHSCCSHLPAFRPFASRVQYFKENMDRLDLSSQIIVSVLVSLGARASPHSTLIGVDGVDIESGQTPVSLLLTAGQRRETAWRSIASRAVELCSRPEVVQAPSRQNVESLLAISAMLKLCETRPTRARYFLRNVVGMFEDLQASDTMSEAEVRDLKAAVGPTVYESDARVAAYLSMAVLISDQDVENYFDGANIIIPDLRTASLMNDLLAILSPARGALDRNTFDDALGIAAYYVCAIQRSYAGICSSRRASSSFLTEIPKLWTYIDSAHGAVQHLHRTLVSLDLRDDYSNHAIEYDLLISVRLDTRLIDVINLTHSFLCRQLERSWSEQDHITLQQLTALSERRVRKALKLLSFYAKVFSDSRDKHLVYHLFLQLDILPAWADMVPQRVGEPTAFGPLNEESALTEQELDWFVKALEMACFYTPSANAQLETIKRGREQRRSTPTSRYNYNFAPAAPAYYHEASSSSGADSSPKDVGLNGEGRYDHSSSNSCLVEVPPGTHPNHMETSSSILSTIPAVASESTFVIPSRACGVTDPVYTYDPYEPPANLSEHSSHSPADAVVDKTTADQHPWAMDSELECMLSGATRSSEASISELYLTETRGDGSQLHAHSHPDSQLVSSKPAGNSNLFARRRSQDWYLAPIRYSQNSAPTSTVSSSSSFGHSHAGPGGVYQENARWAGVTSNW
ncbi:BQ2448_4618 [Microbotryum intermedium]|uniref:BQ2448_4618 protein n=1 Tax=Microbotryum intermedium TaxID=269621 RepID=A0A238FJ61_9BASI|nr:BQ2448_4618 [Microbotryum intermedium]